MTKLICPHCNKKMVDLGWGVPVCPEHPANIYPIQMAIKYRGYKKMYKVIKINEPTKHELVCELCGMFIEISDEQEKAILEGANLINNAFPDDMIIIITDVLNRLYASVECQHDFRWIINK